jgi:hypothetical protein
MSLGSVIHQISALLPPGTKSVVGPEHLKAHDAPPRVVWVPSRDRYGPPESTGANPRSLRTRLAGCEVHVWGADYDATEALLNLVQAAIHYVTYGSYQLDQGDAGWLALDGPLQNLGRAYVFHVVFKIPVTEAPMKTAPVKSIPQTQVIALGSPPRDEPAD